jgi:hypothetical protein
MKKAIALAAALFLFLATAAAAVPAAATGHVLPSEYMELEYIESDGDEVIDTGIPVNSGIRFEVTFQVVDPELPGKGSSAGIVGTYIDGSDKTGRFQIAYSRTQNYITMGMGMLLVNEPQYIEKDTEKHTAVLDAPAGTFTFDGRLVASMDPAELKINDTNPKLVNFTIGGTNFGTTTESVESSGNGATKFFHVSFEKDGVMIAEFIPAVRLSDSYVGMYDIVRGRFFENVLFDDVPFLADPAVVTTAEVSTSAPATHAPSTSAAPSDTQVPVTTDPSALTAAPVTQPVAEKGCGSSAAALFVLASAVCGCVITRRKRG